jgi:hypothetical protein
MTEIETFWKINIINWDILKLYLLLKVKGESSWVICEILSKIIIILNVFRQ